MTEKSSKLSYDIAKIYKKYLLRDPDRKGLTHWINQISSNQISLDELEKNKVYSCMIVKNEAPIIYYIKAFLVK